MTATSVSSPPIRANAPLIRANGQRGEPAILVLLCTDVGDGGDCPVAPPDLAAAVRRDAPQATSVPIALGAARVCARPGRLAEVIGPLGAHRVVLGCRHLDEERDAITASLRAAGVSLAGIRLVDLRPERRADPARVAWQSAARIVAAIAGIAHADLDVPEREHVVAGPLSRRSLFRPGSVGRRPVASWLEGRCAGGAECTACVVACPRGALRCTPAGPVIDEAACTGCGACVSACRAGALALAGYALSRLEAEAMSLAAQARQAGRDVVAGVALACAQATPGLRVGGDWLPLELPSLEMVTAEWVLALRAAGVTVALVPCGDEPCAGRGREIGELCARFDGCPAEAPPAEAPPAEAPPAESPPGDAGPDVGSRLCVSCGQPLAAGLADVAARRIAASHPRIAARLTDEDRCTDCLLTGARSSMIAVRKPRYLVETPPNATNLRRVRGGG